MTSHVPASIVPVLAEHDPVPQAGGWVVRVRPTHDGGIIVEPTEYEDGNAIGVVHRGAYMCAYDERQVRKAIAWAQAYCERQGERRERGRSLYRRVLDIIKGR